MALGGLQNCRCGFKRRLWTMESRLWDRLACDCFGISTVHQLKDQADMTTNRVMMGGGAGLKSRMGRSHRTVQALLLYLYKKCKRNPQTQSLKHLRSRLILRSTTLHLRTWSGTGNLSRKIVNSM